MMKKDCIQTPMLLACAVLLACQPIQANEEITSPRVLYVAPNGSDDNPGTAERPLQTLAVASALAKAGTTVLLSAGTYPEQLVTRHGGTKGYEIVFKSLNGPVVIDGSELGWETGKDQNQGLVELRHPYVRLEGLVIQNSKNSGVLLAADHLVVENCEITQIYRHGITSHTSFQVAAKRNMLRDIRLQNNRIHHTTLGKTGYGQAISLIADGFTIQGNAVYSNGDIGIDIWLGASHGEVVDNATYDNAAMGIYVDGASYLRIHRNRVYSNHNGLFVSSEDPRYESHHVWIYNNLIYDHPNGDGCGIWDPDTGVRDILFANNTLSMNNTGFRFSGSGLSAEVVNNIGQAIRTAYSDVSNKSQINAHHNRWIPSLTGFLNPLKKDFHLTKEASAIAQGTILSPLLDDLGQSFPLDRDFDNHPRNNPPDLGAYQKQ